MRTPRAVMCAVALLGACGDTVIEILPPAPESEAPAEPAGDGSDEPDDAGPAPDDRYVPPGMPVPGDCLLVAASEDQDAAPRLLRSAVFKRSPRGYMRSPDGHALVGYAVSEEPDAAQEARPLVLPTGVPEHATTWVELSLNLNSFEGVLPPWDLADPGATSNFSTGSTVYDRFGLSHALTVYFRASRENLWQWHALVDGADLEGGVQGVAVEGASGQLEFNSAGWLRRAHADPTAGWTFRGTDAAQHIEFDFGASEEDATGGDPNQTTQFGDAEYVQAVASDGAPYRRFTGYEGTPEGMITGVTEQGTRHLLGWLALAQLESNAGLRRAHDGSFVAPTEGSTWLAGTGAESGVAQTLPCAVDVQVPGDGWTLSLTLTAL